MTTETNNDKVLNFLIDTLKSDLSRDEIKKYITEDESGNVMIISDFFNSNRINCVELFNHIYRNGNIEPSLNNKVFISYEALHNFIFKFFYSNTFTIRDKEEERPNIKHVSKLLDMVRVFDNIKDAMVLGLDSVMKEEGLSFTKDYTIGLTVPEGVITSKYYPYYLDIFKKEA